MERIRRWFTEPLAWEEGLARHSPWTRYSRRKRVWSAIGLLVFTVAVILGTLWLLHRGGMPSDHSDPLLWGVGTVLTVIFGAMFAVYATGDPERIAAMLRRTRVTAAAMMLLALVLFVVVVVAVGVGVLPR